MPSNYTCGFLLAALSQEDSRDLRPNGKENIDVLNRQLFDNLNKCCC